MPAKAPQKPTKARKPVSEPAYAKLIGRPPMPFNQEACDYLCERFATSEDSMATICAEPGMPSVTTIFKWLRTRESFALDYARARTAQAQYMAEQTVEIADDGRNDWMQRQNFDGNEVGWHLNGEAVARSRLRADTRKWHAAHLDPKKYGEKIEVDQTLGVTDALGQLLSRVSENGKRLCPGLEAPKAEDDNTTE